MARLTRSAARAAAPAADEPPVLYPLLRELTPKSSEPSTDVTSKLSESAPMPARKRAEGTTKTPRSRMPVPAAAAQTISYPSLEGLDDDKSLPKTPTGKDNTPAAPPPLTTARKPTRPSLAEQASMPGAFGGDALGFEFNFSAGLGEYSHKVLDEVREKAKDIRAQMDNSNPTTPPTNSLLASPTKMAATTVKRNRFAEVHQAEFEKMPSIAAHYAAKRKVVTPQNPQKGIKRTQSQATLDQKSLPPTPSPVKKLPDQTVERKSKRVKIEPVSSFASKISGVSATPKRAPKPVSSARTAVARRVSNQKRPMPALPPRESGIEPTVRLVPTSRIPVTPSSRVFHNIAPATVAAAPKFSLPDQRSAAQAPSTAVKPRAIKPLKKSAAPVSTATPSVSSTHVGVLSPIKITDTNLDDPFGSRDPPPSFGWGFQTPADNPTMPVFPNVPTHAPTLPSRAGALLNANKKRQDTDTDEDTDMTTAPAVPSSPIRKKLRFDGDVVMEKGKGHLDKARLDFLATPKRKNDKRRDTRSSIKSVKRPVWK